MTSSWLNRLFTRPNRAARRAKTFRPSLETLDRRDVPAVTAAFSAATGTLTVTGDDLDNTITVSRDVAGSILVNAGAVPITGDVANVTNVTLIQVLGQAGNDTIALDETNGALPAAEFHGGAGNDTFTGGSGNDFIDGDQGSDTALMGAGDDTFQWDPGDGSDMVEGQAGADTMLFNGAAANEVFEVSANGGRVRFTRNVGNIVMDIDDIESIDLNALGGTDTTTINDVSGTDLTEVNINQAGAIGGTTGDTQADIVIVNGTNGNDAIIVQGTGTSYSVAGLSAAVNVSNSEGADGLTINALGGDDTVTATALPAGIVSLTLDGGAGNDSLLGSQAADVFFGGDGNDFVFGDNGNDTAFLGAGDDVFQWDPGDGSDTIEGQDGTDEMLFNGAGANENIDISANGGRVRFFRDVASITMDLDDTEVITFNALGGSDNVVVGDLTGTDVTDVFANLSGALTTPGVGDGKPDTVTVTGTPGNDTIIGTVVGGEIRITGLTALTHVTGTDATDDRVLVNGGGGSDTIDLSALSAALPPPVPNTTVLVGADATGAPLVVEFNPDGTPKGTTTVFDAAFTGGVRVASGDVNGDGIADMVVGTGPGIATQVRVLDGKTGAELLAVNPFEAAFTGGVFVAVGDMNGDGKADLVITPDEGGGPRVRILSGVDGSPLADFFGIEDVNFRGGARAAVGDVNNDGTLDLIVAAGFGGGPRLAGFDGKSVLAGQPTHLFNDLFVFEQTLRNGVFVTSGDLNGDGFDDLIVGGGPGGGPRVFAISGKDLVESGSGAPVQLANFFAGDVNNRGGVRLAVKDLDGDNRADLMVGAGTGAGSRVAAFAGKSIPTDGVPPELFGFDVFPGFTGGVFVG